MNIEQKPSPNFNDRKMPVDMLVLHYTGMESGEAALGRMRDSVASVSAHYMIWEDGRVTQLVDESKRAWHAGVGSWQGDTDLNSCSIGIEIVNGGHNVPLADGSLPPYPDIQIRSVIDLSKAILARHKIPLGRVVGHSDIAPDRKEDPGEHFPWELLAQNGIGYWPKARSSNAALPMVAAIGKGLWPTDSGAPVERLQNMLRTIGYGVSTNGQYDDALSNTVRAFQRRWLPALLTGHADLETIALIAQISDALGEQDG